MEATPLLCQGPGWGGTLPAHPVPRPALRLTGAQIGDRVVGHEVGVAQVSRAAAHHRVVWRQRVVVGQHPARRRACPAALLDQGH